MYIYIYTYVHILNTFIYIYMYISVCVWPPDVHRRNRQAYFHDWTIKKIIIPMRFDELIRRLRRLLMVAATRCFFFTVKKPMLRFPARHGVAPGLMVYLPWKSKMKLDDLVRGTPHFRKPPYCLEMIWKEPWHMACKSEPQVLEQSSGEILQSLGA